MINFEKINTFQTNAPPCLQGGAKMGGLALVVLLDNTSAK